MFGDPKFKVLAAGYAPDALGTLKAILNPLGCQVITASSVALALFLAQKNLPCLVLCSAVGLGDEILELVSQIKSDDEFQSIEVVATTDDATRHLVNAALEAGAIKCLSEDAMDTSNYQKELRPFLYSTDKKLDDNETSE